MTKVEEPHPRDRLSFSLAQNDHWTLEKIGDHLGGISRQRVSQGLKRLSSQHLDPRRSRWPKPELLIKACDRAHSCSHAAEILGINARFLKSILKMYMLASNYERHWRERRQELHRRRLLKIMRVLARNLQHTPSIPETNWYARTRTRKRIPYASAWINAFGSFRNAQALAGLQPNQRGGDRYHHKAP